MDSIPYIMRVQVANETPTEQTKQDLIDLKKSLDKRHQPAVNELIHLTNLRLKIAKTFEEIQGRQWRRTPLSIITIDHEVKSLAKKARWSQVKKEAHLLHKHIKEARTVHCQNRRLKKHKGSESFNFPQLDNQFLRYDIKWLQDALDQQSQLLKRR